MRTASGGRWKSAESEEDWGKPVEVARVEGLVFSEPSVAKRLPLWGFPIHCASLPDGRILIVYGRRKAPFGIRAAISEDEGRTWGEEIVIRDDLPNRNLGYPSAIEYESGKLFTVYYGEDGKEVTCIQGTFLTV